MTAMTAPGASLCTKAATAKSAAPLARSVIRLPGSTGSSLANIACLLAYRWVRIWNYRHFVACGQHGEPAKIIILQDHSIKQLLGRLSISHRKPYTPLLFVLRVIRYFNERPPKVQQA